MSTACVNDARKLAPGFYTGSGTGYVPSVNNYGKNCNKGAAGGCQAVTVSTTPGFVVFGGEQGFMYPQAELTCTVTDQLNLNRCMVRFEELVADGESCSNPAWPVFMPGSRYEQLLAKEVIADGGGGGGDMTAAVNAFKSQVDVAVVGFAAMSLIVGVFFGYWLLGTLRARRASSWA